MQIEFELSDEEDFDEILSLINILNREMWSDIIPEEHYKEPFLTQEQFSQMTTFMDFYVLRENNEIIAVGSFASRDDETAWIPVMYVKSPFQRKGIGSKLMEFLEGIARERNYQNLHLETDSEVHWAVSFYEKHGFRTFKKDKTPWGYHIWMGKQL